EFFASFVDERFPFSCLPCIYIDTVMGIQISGSMDFFWNSIQTGFGNCRERAVVTAGCFVPMVTEKSIAIVGQDSCGLFIKFSVGGSGLAEIGSGRTAKKNIWKSFRYIFVPV